MVMDSLALKLCLRNKRSKGELTSVIKHHEELSLVHSGLPENVRRNTCDLKYWKVGWIEEIDEKLNSRSLVVKENKEKEILKTNDKFIMKHAIDYVQDKKHKVMLLDKINEVRQHKGVMIPYGLLGENGRTLTNCGHVLEEKSSLRWKKGIISKRVPSKASKKAREDFIR